MTYFDAFKSGNLVLPSALLLHFKELFPSSDDFLVWQFFYLQNTSALDELSPSQIAETIGKELADVIHYTIAIAAVNGIDLEKVILEKDLSAAIKYKHTTNLTEFLQKTAKYD